MHRFYNTLFTLANKSKPTSLKRPRLVANSIKTRKTIGFKSLQLNYWGINQATSKCQINLWTKFAKKV